ncbi:MAG: penicillin-binding protein 2 [Candidatus Terrybacteria bacterium RIFCSPLOWO2_01_FULL_44_24]|uniref:Penicillin-binding protein 2 n=1 Tax=Candidatus Terrybacteria bacterium RIFCSPHIGHO2_01_FULL_43_35 TaxID=1802361 RepID=A0A1G2PFM8_9BACT|nr:MAG: penicillin-binding protein 2 [Candidatus Terrybacteria bacterium RIFCSPHIGHO2_01_FULL_43_35]OHA49931.1 MAG: penicillin-binding protein 2 [Candidatus Terrybacteria bacterium RIFCSPHIGHO2_02_FULL_43_14]OHA51748.1 MAG: penicillin-binding protein 2 [Candidatus Terrybacteria bacterium RIFCSPLOWO2_01_FULL_44_24]
MKFPGTEFEEIIADVSRQDDSKGLQLEVPINRRAPQVLLLIIIIVFSLFWIRTAWLTVFKGAQLAAIAVKNTERIFPIIAPRGIVYDRNGEELVKNTASFRVIVDRTRLPQDKSVFSAQIEKIAGILSMSLADLEDKIMQAPQAPYFVLLREITQENAVALSVFQSENDIFWLDVESVPKRKYKDGSFFSHILGYTGEMTKDDLASHSNAFLTEEIGKTGVEFSFDNILRGITGEHVFVVNADGKTNRNFVARESKSGDNIRLKIDAKLQRAIYASLQKETRQSGAKAAAAVALDPRDGSVRALVSLPGFDNNVFSQGISSEDYNKLIQDNAKPLLNRVISGLYPVGSTIKPMVGLAALAENVISPTKRIFDPGFITVKNIYNPSITYTYKDWRAHGGISFVDAIAESCDVYFYTIGGGYGDVVGLGIDRLAAWLKNFNFDQKTGIDLSGELSGTVPDPAWKQEKKNESWVLGDTYHLSIGQGDFLATPLELAVATAAVVNDGTIYKPNLVDAIIKSDGTEDKKASQVIKYIDADKDYFDLVKKGMRGTVNSPEGTAKLLANVSVPVSAKTGTAEVGSKVPHAWVTAFAPSDNPELVIAIIIEHAGEGSAFAVPVVRDAFDAYFTK